MSDLLFDLPESKSPRLLWREKHKFVTHHFPAMADELGDSPAPWIAIKPLPEHEGMEIAEIMAKSAALYDANDLIGEGETEWEAIENCAVRIKIRLWNETA